MTNNIIFKVAKVLVSICLLTLFWLFFFAALSSDDSGINYEPFNGASILLAIGTHLVISFAFQYNKVVKLKEDVNIAFYGIEIKEKHVISLIGQLEKVTDKIIDHELKMSLKKTYSELVDNEKVSDHYTSDGNRSHHHQSKRRDSNESGAEGHHENISQVSDKVTKLVESIERDTKGMANQSLQELMGEIKEAEILVTQQRLHYNDTVSQYNRAIYALPFAFFRSSLGFFERNYA